MEEKKELHRLCQEIKRMIPAVSLNPDATEPFTNFLKLLKGKGISPEEIECIHRAYNYFNQIISNIKPRSSIEGPTGSGPPPANGNDGNDGLTGESYESGATGESYESGATGESYESGATGATGASDPDESASYAPDESGSLTGPSTEPSDEFKIEALIQLFELNRQRMAAQDMKQVADSIAKSMPLPDIKMDWTSSPIPSVNGTTLVDKINYQTAVAGKIQELMNPLTPESEAVIESALDVLQLFHKESFSLSNGSWNGSTWKDSSQRSSPKNRTEGGNSLSASSTVSALTANGNSLLAKGPTRESEQTQSSENSVSVSVEILPEDPLFIAAQQRMVEAADLWVKSLN